MPIRLVKEAIPKTSYDATVRALKTNCDQSIVRGFHKGKIIFFVKVPKWIDGQHGEAELLTQRYTDVLKLAEDNNCKSIILPLDLTGHSFPKDKIYPIVINAISCYLENSELIVYLMISNVRTFRSGCSFKEKLVEYLSEVYEPAIKRDSLFKRLKNYFKPIKSNKIQSGPTDTQVSADKLKKHLTDEHRQKIRDILEQEHKGYIQIPESLIKQLNDLLELESEETFTEMMLRIISEKGMKPSRCYKNANMDKRLFSKIKRDKNYHPQKETAIALALGLELDIEQTKLFLMKAGYALSHIDKRDVIVEFFIKAKQYNIMEIEGFLFEKGLKLLSNYE